MPERAPAKSSNAPLILIAVFGWAILGGGGYFGMEMMKKMDVMSAQLQETKDELRLANDKLSKAEKDTQAAKEDAKLAKEASDLAAKKQAEEAEARKLAAEIDRGLRRAGKLWRAALLFVGARLAEEWAEPAAEAQAVGAVLALLKAGAASIYQLQRLAKELEPKGKQAPKQLAGGAA